MITRRDTLHLLASSPLALLGATAATAVDTAPPALSAAAPPQVAGMADFAGAWSPDVPEGVEVFAVEPDITTGIAELIAGVQFTSYAELDSYCRSRLKTDYISWFNANLAGKDQWAERRISGPAAAENFEAFWKNFLKTHPVSLMEFIAYMAIFTNECGGNLVSRTEGFGAASHPGIAYLFDRIVTVRNGKTWSKRSYNTGSDNKSASVLFNDANFNSAHGGLALADRLKNSSDGVWRGDVFPQSGYSTSGRPDLTGYLLESDFFKFRGRGLIQTTWRSNYRKLVEFVSGYRGNSPVVLEYKSKWAGMGADQICTVSTNADWDRLFADSSQAILCQSIQQHAASGSYLPLAATSSGLNAGVDRPGSVGCMALRIGGGKAYAAAFKGRMRQTCDVLVETLNG